MATSTCLFALFLAVVVCYAEAIRIDTVPPNQRNDKPIPGLTINDPRCKKKGSEKLPVPNDCTKYLKCVDGTSLVVTCPSGLKFDSRNICVNPSTETADCGRKKLSAPLDEVEEECDNKYEIKPMKSDCHKYIVCRGPDPPVIRECPPGMRWNANGNCEEGDECPPQPSEDSVCKNNANQLLPDEKDDRGYIKCVNSKATRKKCPPGTAFDPSKRKCTTKQLQKIKNNDIWNIELNE